MIDKLFQSLHESVKKRNTPDSYVIEDPKDVDVIHRGYIKNAAMPLKYDFIPKENGKSRNEGDHVYKFGSTTKGGVVHIDHRVNKNQESGHETTSTFASEILNLKTDIDLRRTIIPAVLHHIKSHDPDILKFKSGFKFVTDIIKEIDPDKTKFKLKRTKSGIVFTKNTPVDEKSKRIISHIKSKMSINKNKEN